MEDLPVFLFSEQTTTCPRCGIRTEIISEGITNLLLFQEHRCLSKECGFEFKMEEEEKIGTNK